MMMHLTTQKWSINGSPSKGNCEISSSEKLLLIIILFLFFSVQTVSLGVV